MLSRLHSRSSGSVNWLVWELYVKPRLYCTGLNQFSVHQTYSFAIGTKIRTHWNCVKQGLKFPLFSLTPLWCWDSDLWGRVGAQLLLVSPRESRLGRSWGVENLQSSTPCCYQKHCQCHGEEPSLCDGDRNRKHRRSVFLFPLPDFQSPLVLPFGRA